MKLRLVAILRIDLERSDVNAIGRSDHAMRQIILSQPVLQIRWKKIGLGAVKQNKVAIAKL
jgi:hypothetical protein